MTNFIKLQYAEFLEDYTDGALFLGRIATDQIFTSENIYQINGLLEDAGRYTIQESVLSFFESIGYTEKDIAELYNAYAIGDDPDDFDTAEEFADHIEISLHDVVDYDCGEFLNNMLYYIQMDQNNKGDDLTEALLDYLGLEAFTVGYSPWSLVVTYKGSNREFYEDLYNGWNFYDIAEIDQHGEVLDSIGAVYARNEKDLSQAVEEAFGIIDFKLIDNEEAGAFNLPKAETITTYK